MVLHDYWRSSAAYRVRIALRLKGVDFTSVPHDLRANEQSAPDYVAIAPQGLVPALDTGSQILVQSPAILEWLEETYPSPALLPTDPADRAVVRAMAAVVACDIHPVNNLRILRALKNDFGAEQAVIDAWVRRWIGDGFAALETMVAQHGRGWAFGAAPTIADVTLVPQWYNAERFALDTAAYPHLASVVERARAHPAFAAAAPEVHPHAG